LISSWKSELGADASIPFPHALPPVKHANHEFSFDELALESKLKDLQITLLRSAVEVATSLILKSKLYKILARLCLMRFSVKKCATDTM
jgi:hypothetical protein